MIIRLSDKIHISILDNNKIELQKFLKKHGRILAPENNNGAVGVAVCQARIPNRETIPVSCKRAVPYGPFHGARSLLYSENIFPPLERFEARVNDGAGRLEDGFRGGEERGDDSRKGAPPQANGPIRAGRTFCPPFHLHRRNNHRPPPPPPPLPPLRHTDTYGHPRRQPAHLDAYFSPLRSREGGFPCFSSPPFVSPRPPRRGGKGARGEGGFL